MNLNDFKFTPSLAFCVIMDAIGVLTYALPFLGEFADVVWAPLSALVFYKSFGGAKGLIGGIFNGLEEIIPYTDFIPSFTIMYFIKDKKWW
jgi:hypothetical protein